jgi:hypothetical protein
VDYNNNKVNDDDYYDDEALHDEDANRNNNEVPVEADAPLEDGNLRRVCLLAGVVRTNQDYSLGLMVSLPDASAVAPAAFKAMELKAQMYFASCSLMGTGRFLKEHLPICFHCLHWNLTSPFLQCNRDGLTGYRLFLYIQLSCCKDISIASLS